MNDTLRRLAVAAFPLAVVLTLPDAVSSAETEAAVETHRYPVPGGAALELRVPAGWTERVEKASASKFTEIALEAPSKEMLLITIFPAHPANAARARALTERTGTELLPTAVETKLVIDELAGTSHVGYHYTFTDRRLVGKVPPPGEFLVITQGHLPVGDFAVFFTFLCNDKTVPAREAAIGILRTASQASAI